MHMHTYAYVWAVELRMWSMAGLIAKAGIVIATPAIMALHGFSLGKRPIC
jgi:hypothetical protein